MPKTSVDEQESADRRILYAEAKRLMRLAHGCIEEAEQQDVLMRNGSKASMWCNRAATYLSGLKGLMGEQAKALWVGREQNNRST